MSRSLRLATALSGLLIAAPSALAQTWVLDIEHFAEPNMASALAVSDEGLVAVVRNTHDIPAFAPRRAGVTLLSASGEALSHYTFGGESVDEHEDLQIFDAVFDGENGVVLCGSLEHRAYLGRLDLDSGSMTWEKSLTTIDGEFRFIARNDLGHFVVAGRHDGLGKETLLAAYSATGGTLWYRDYSTPASNDLVIGLEGFPNGELALVQRSDGVLVVHRLTNYGHPLWSRRYTGSASLAPSATGIGAQGELLIAGPASADNSQFVARLGADGKVDACYGYTLDHSSPNLIQVDAVMGAPDGGIWLGSSAPNPEPLTYRSPHLVRLDAAGAPLWVRNLGSNRQEADIRLEPGKGGVVYGTASSSYAASFVFRADSSGETGPCAGAFVDVSPLDVSLESEPIDLTYGQLDDFIATIALDTFLFTPEIVTKCETPCEIVGGSYGLGTPGTFGIAPTLTATDGLCLGHGPELRITSGLGGSLALIGVSLSPAQAQLFGGLLYLNPFDITLLPPVILNGTPGFAGAGSATIPLGGDLSGLAGQTLHLQAYVLDQGAPGGWSMTQAATLTGQ